MSGAQTESFVVKNLMFTNIFQTFQMAIQPSKLIIAFLGVAVICLSGWVMDFSRTVVVSVDRDNIVINSELQTYIIDPELVQLYIDQQVGKNREYRGVFSTLWNFSAARFHGVIGGLFQLNIPAIKTNIEIYFKAVSWVFRYHFIYGIIFILIKLAVISVAGGAIHRA